MAHDTITVHAFITRLIEYLKEVKPECKKLIYFSDGAASQYKNYKNFVNLCHHQIDHSIQAEWHFFATSHGKSPCDGLGGTTKRLIARASLQAAEKDQILTPPSNVDWADQNIEGIKFFFVSDGDVQKNASRFQLNLRYSLSKTITGTRSHHSFVPISKCQIQMRRLSVDILSDNITIGNSKFKSGAIQNMPIKNTDEYHPGKYIASLYEYEWYIGIIIERSEEHSDVFVKFMKRSKDTILSWPQNMQDQCWVPFQDIICTISSPVLEGRLGRQYKLSPSDFNNISVLISKK